MEVERQRVQPTTDSCCLLFTRQDMQISFVMYLGHRNAYRKTKIVTAFQKKLLEERVLGYIVRCRRSCNQTEKRQLL